VPRLTHEEILGWLRESRPSALEELFARANQTRRAHAGDAVHLRGLVEISSHCVRQCHYCGLRAARSVPRYRMTRAEILACAQQAVRLGFGTLVIQAGEDFGIQAEWLAEIVRVLKAETPLAVTLSLGERLPEEFALWRRAGADRYLLRFETSNRALYDAIHPPRGAVRSDRIAMLRELRALGYEIGSGVMVGIPGQTFEMLARDIELFEELDLDMVGIGPFLAHPDTPLGAQSSRDAGGDQVPSSEWMVLKAVALTRLVCPQANLPSTTALATINTVDGREHGLESGANVFMPVLTPAPYRKMYEIYPGKACVDEDATQCNRCLRERVVRLGRFIGEGPGSRRTGPALHREQPPRREPRPILEPEASPLLVVLQ
jgi:biotin synthase